MDDQGRDWPQPPQVPPQQNEALPPAGTPVQNYEQMAPPTSANPFAAPSAPPNATFTPQPPIPLLPKKSRKKRIIASSVAAALTVLLGGSVLAYTFWYQNPNKVVGDAVLHTLDATSATYTGTLDVTSKDNQKVHVAFDGNSADGDNSLNAKGSFTAPDNKQYSLGGGLVLKTDGTVFFKINGLHKLADDNLRGEAPSPEAMRPIDDFIAKVDDKWVKADSTDTKKFSQPIGKMQKCFADLSKKIREDGAMRAEIAGVYNSHQFVTIGKSLGDKNGSLGYEITFSSAKQQEFYQAAKSTKMYKFLHDCDSDITIDAPETSPASEKDTTKLELWVSRWQHEITKLTANDTTSDGTKVSASIEPVFNKKVIVKAPEKSMTLEQLMAEVTKLLQASMTGVSPAAAASDDLFS